MTKSHTIIASMTDNYRLIYASRFGAGPYVCCFCGKPVGIDEFIVHHKNEDRTDNRVQNLSAAHSACHTRYHHVGKRGRGLDKKPRKRMTRIPCQYCGREIGASWHRRHEAGCRSGEFLTDEQREQIRKTLTQGARLQEARDNALKRWRGKPLGINHMRLVVELHPSEYETTYYTLRADFAKASRKDKTLYDFTITGDGAKQIVIEYRHLARNQYNHKTDAKRWLERALDGTDFTWTFEQLTPWQKMED